MSEHQQLNQLLDRAVEHAPDTHLGGEQMLTAGRRRVRQRRVVAGGTAVGTLTLAAAVWTAATGSGLLSTSDTAPAGTTATQATPTTSASLPVAAQERIITLREGEDVLTFSDGTVTLGGLVLHLREDGSSSVDVTVNGAVSTVAATPVLHGRATAYRGEEVTIVTAPALDLTGRSAILGVGEAVSDTFQVDDQPMTWWAVHHGPDVGPEAGLPSDILLVDDDGAELVSGATVHAAQVVHGSFLAVAWDAPSTGQWGISTAEGTSTTPGELLLWGDEDEDPTWAAKVPLGARSVRLATPATGDTVAGAEWFVTVGEHQIAGGRTTWEESAAVVVEWDDASGTTRGVSGDTVGGTGAFAGWTFTVDAEQGLAVDVGYRGGSVAAEPSSLGAGLRVFPVPDDPAHELVALPIGVGEDAVLRFLDRTGTGFLPVDGRLVSDQTLQTSHGALRLLKVPAGSFAPDAGGLLAVRYPVVTPGAAEGFNTWRLLGADGDQGVMAVDPGLAVEVAPGQGWLLYRGGIQGDGGALRGGTLGATLHAWVRDADPETVDLVAVLEAGTDAELIVPDGFRVEDSQTHVGPVDGYEVFTATVNQPVDGGPVEAAYGLDTDGDGQVDIPAGLGAPAG